jgi:hypothetical protein
MMRPTTMNPIMVELFPYAGRIRRRSHQHRTTGERAITRPAQLGARADDVLAVNEHEPQGAVRQVPPKRLGGRQTGANPAICSTVSRS